jgi:hypothetical protein
MKVLDLRMSAVVITLHLSAYAWLFDNDQQAFAVQVTTIYGWTDCRIRGQLYAVY